MTNANSKNTVNQPDPVKKNRNLVREFVAPFIETKVTSQGGVKFYNQAKSSNGNLLGEFLMYWKSRDEWNNLTKDEKATLESLEKTVFLKEIVRIGAGFESKRSAILYIIGRDYDFSAIENKKVESEIQELYTNELNNLVQSENLREKFLKGLFPKKNLPHREQEAKIDFVFSPNHLNEKQRESILALLVKSHVDESDVTSALPLFTHSTDQKLLIKMFLPTITLGQLEGMGVLNKKQVQKAISESISRGNLGAHLHSMNDQERQEVVAYIDPDDIVIETMLFPDEVVDTILHGTGRKLIAQELTRRNDDLYKSLEGENNLHMKPTNEGLFYPPFIAHLRKLGIKDAANFTPGSIVKGKVSGKGGEDIHFAYRIEGIDDDIEKNKETGGNDRVITATDVLLPDGTLHLAKKKSVSPEFTYAALGYILASAKNSLEIVTDQDIKKQIQGGKMKESLYEEDIQNLADLNRALDSIDEQGSKYPLTKAGGASIQVGEPGKAGYWVYQITSVNADKGTIELHNGQKTEILDFVHFFTAFKTQKATRLPSMKDMGGLLGALKEYGSKKDAYVKLSMDEGKIVPDDRMSDKEFPGITEFAGKKSFIKVLDSKNTGTVEFLVYDDYDEKLKLDKQKKTPKKYIGSYHLLYNFLNQEAYTPVAKEKDMQAPEKVDAHEHYHKGFIKGYLGNPSLHDIFKGGKDLVGFLKHHLEHGSSVQSANMQLALGKKLKWLGVDDGMIRELRSKVYAGNKKLMTELVDTFKGMPSKERFKEVEHILLNKGSHDYEIHAATIAMLQKHGNLYAGEMKKFQGSFLYFERLAGIKYSPHLQIGTGENAFKVQSYMDTCIRTGEPFREEGLIQHYLRWAGSDKGGYKVDGNLWLEIKKGWVSGMTDENASGKRETDQLHTQKGRTAYVMGKLKDGEYAHGLGGIDAIWGKGGAPHEMHMSGIVLALSGIPGNLHQEQLNTLKNKFFAGHPYTAFLFLGTLEDQKLFQSVIKKLCEDNPEMSSAYKKIETLQSSDPDKKLIGTIIEFWEKYGAILNDRLNVTQDGTLLKLAKTDSNCAKYLKTCKDSYSLVAKLDPGENFGHEGSSFLALNSDQYFKFIKVNAGQSVLEMNDDTTAGLFSGFKKSIEAIKTMKVGTQENTEDIQKSLYLQYHHAFMKFLTARFKDKAYDEVQNQIFFKEMESKYGMSLIPYGMSLESVEYNQKAEADFDAYMKKGGRSVSAETINVAGSVENLLEKSGYRDQASNNVSAKPTA